MSQPNQNNNNNHDHKHTKIFVGGLAWSTTTDDLRRCFQRFGEVLHANVVTETCPGGRSKSKGYGFVIFRDAESAARACETPNPVIDGRQTEINMAYLRAKNTTNHPYHPNQNGSLLHPAGPSHQYQNYGPPNQGAWHQQYQPNLAYSYPQFPSVYWDPSYYGQYPYMYNSVPCYPFPNTMHTSYVSTYGMHPNWRHTPPRVLINARGGPSLVEIEDMSETTNDDQGEGCNADVVNMDDNIQEEADTEPDSDVDQPKGKDGDKAEMMMSGVQDKDDDIKQDADSTQQLHRHGFDLSLHVEFSPQQKENGVHHEEDGHDVRQGDQSI